VLAAAIARDVKGRASLLVYCAGIGRLVMDQGRSWLSARTCRWGARFAGDAAVGYHPWADLLGLEADAGLAWDAQAVSCLATQIS
jgi:hypothetical protein